MTTLEAAASRDIPLSPAELDLLMRLVAAAGDQSAFTGLVAERMEAVGCAVEPLVYDPQAVPLIEEFASGVDTAAGEQTCLIGRIAPSTAADGARSLLLFAHPDVEAFQADHGWSHDPREPRVENGRLIGWGVADDIAGIMIMVASLARLHARGWTPPAPVTLVSSPSKRHRRGIAAALAAGLSADAAIYLHPAESGAGLDEIKAFAPGQIEFAVEIAGRLPQTDEPSHAAFAHLAHHPLDAMRAVLDALASLDRARGKSVQHPLLQAAVGRSTNLLVTRIEAGSTGASARIPASCRIAAVLSLVPGETLAEAKAVVEDAVSGAWQGLRWPEATRPDVTWLSGVSAAETDVDGPLYQLVRAMLLEAGANPRVNPLHTSSDIRNPLVQRSIPTVGYGPRCGDLTMAKGVGEWVDLADLSRAIDVTASIIEAWCEAPSSTTQP
ncbi:M20 family metallopeptidase [Aureimonas phyllosphaerae]|uniref:Acetylornithine deacetylase/succinyl-diaminopimelate desuccinylase-like protein n=1 Tax=Aureimonas phyllosphaerae TaxID=1166078 RepID=A0A7W6BVT9_9HYPH|nr:M20/M25/M40 family metallo-hydrolase [Aureimonas phyllosphaerae]MBB3936999.1 acetylornithine deacetylase/succinyl-diaminopimelate desuccinylase-like protein [Aureimonas phyllosphaerae]MBB3960886.1 acetylornithine deacetylase/succinyl-diaminopimelate desuccinylase-like protein [Aureimonas phyllosphaerae]SFF51588.1 Acetylornithine deacetylase/Succinyl-diaminopimelate desuccinylase [Aureimonas phyllosphaerae]